MMKIVDTSGNELTDRPDYSLGRLLQDPDDEDTLIYTTWEEQPDLDEEGNVIDHTPKPPISEQIETLNTGQTSIENELTMTQVAITEVYELISGGSE